eukprot:COSAG02_NODE_28080_length_596_cov_2.239437_1_plen_75_part_00
MASARRLRDACERGDLEAVNEEIAKGVDVNDVVGASWSALHRAAERGRVQVCAPVSACTWTCVGMRVPAVTCCP